MIDNVSQIITEIVYLYKITRRPVSTRILADIVGYSERHMRRKLNYLRDKGILNKNGQRGGWYPTSNVGQYLRNTSQLAMAA